MSFEVLSDAIDKPLVDDRSYKLIQLKNGLKALLIHDPTTDKSAAGLDVFVGSGKDNHYGIPGLAHFCEHLLFMGTEKYPLENEYGSYLSSHGGHSNAFTSFEHTNYYFEVNSDYLEGALDRFSQFFITPLFSESCKDREINAVDSENKKNLQNDLWRFYQLEKSTSNPVHPFNHFSTGNLITLGEEPVSKGKNVRDILLKFHEDTYSSNIMNLVILGKESLEELTDLVVDKFSEVKDKSLPLKPGYDDEVVYTPEQLGKVVKAKSIMDSNKLEITFMIPDDQDANWKYLPGSYFSHLLGHESKGSVYYYLNELGYVNELSCGSTKICSGSSLFMVECDLTEKGLDNYQEILVHIFEYLKLIKSLGPQEWLFNEIRQSNEINFKFKQKENAARTVSKLSNSLYRVNQFIPPSSIFNYHAKSEFNPGKLEDYSNYLTIDNARFQLTSKTFESLKSREKWYGTEYEYIDISSALIERIKSCTLNDNFKLPLKNHFIPENLDILTNPSENGPLKAPYLIRNDTKFQLWFKQDDQFNVPKTILQVFLHLPQSNESIEGSIQTQLFCDLLDDELNDLSYYASIAGLSFQISQWRDGILLRLNGYSDKIFVLLKDILNKLTEFRPSKQKFQVLKNKLLQDYKNFGYETPYLQINSNFLTMVNEKTYLTVDKIPALEALEFDTIVSFIDKKLFSNVFVESLIIGNINIEQFNNKFQDLMVKHLGHIEAIGSNLDEINQITKLQSHFTDENVVINLELQDPENINSSIEYFIKLESPTNYEARSLTDLISTIFHEPCFNQLRTKEQLGYVVFSGVKTLRNYIGYRVLIQSERSPTYLRSRIENFLKTMGKTLADMSESEFNDYKTTLIDKKLVKLKNLNEESGRFWNSITDGYNDFKVHDKLISYIESITKEKLIDFYDKNINPEASNAKYVLHLNSQKAKFVALKTILNDLGVKKEKDVIEKYQDDLISLVDGDKDLVSKIQGKLEEWFPKYDDKEIGFNDFKKFEKAGIARSVDPLSTFYYTESHL